MNRTRQFAGKLDDGLAGCFFRQALDVPQVGFDRVGRIPFSLGDDLNKGFRGWFFAIVVFRVTSEAKRAGVLFDVHLLATAKAFSETVGGVVRPRLVAILATPESNGRQQIVIYYPHDLPFE